MSFPSFTHAQEFTVETSAHISRRLLKRKDGSTAEFDVLLIDGPEKWPSASEIKSSKTLEFGTKKLKVNLSGISVADFYAIQTATYIPQWDNADGEEPDPKFAEMRADRIADRRMALIEKAVGMKFPGETQEDRREYYNRRSSGEIEALMAAIHSNSTCFVEMMDTPLIRDYRSCCEVGVVADAESFFDNWGEAKDSQYTLLFQRPQDSYITEIRLRGITQDEDIRISKACEPGDPPMRPVRDNSGPRGRIIRSVPNPQDPEYQSRLSACNRKRILMLAESSLTFQIPGTSFEERMAWLSDRIIGDVQVLKAFIENKILSYEEELQSF